MPRLSTLLFYQQRINRILDAVAADPAREFSLDALADIAGLSPFHLHRVFSAMMGESPVACVRRIRLLTAAFRLQFQPGSPVTDIALECGFSSSQNFARSFRVWAGVSPTRFREYCRSNQLPPKLEAQKSKFRNAAPFVLEYLADLEGHTPRIVPNEHILAKGATMNVEVKTLPPRRLAYVRHIGPYADEGVPAAWAKIVPWGMRHGLLEPGGVTVGISWDNPELTEQCRYDACVIVPEGVALDPAALHEQGIGLQTVEGGLYACYRRPVRRDQFSEALNELFGIWLPQSGYECVGAPLEIYHDTQGNAGEENAVWDVSLCMPVRPLA